MTHNVKASDLRIGNVIEGGVITQIINTSDPDASDKVKVRTAFGDIIVPETSISPIKITEEALMGYGFVEDMSIPVMHWYIREDWSLEVGERRVVKGDGPENYINFNWPKYMHKLQNLYFEIEGQEL